MEWLEGIRKLDAEYFINLSRVYNGVLMVMKELEAEIMNWKNEEAKWTTKVVQMREVQIYGVMKFLSKKLVAGLDDGIMYVCQRNIERSNSLIKQAYEEYAKIVDRLAELVASMQNELVCIRIKYLKDDGKTLEAAKVITKSFEGKINYVKEVKDLVPDDLSTIAKIESLLFLCIGHLDSHFDKFTQVRREKDV